MGQDVSTPPAALDRGSLPSLGDPLLTTVPLVRAVLAVELTIALRVGLPHAAAVLTLEGEGPTRDP